MRSIPVSTGGVGVQAVPGPCTVYGYSVRESAGTAAVATAILRDGTSAAGPARVFIELPADGSQTERIPGVPFYNGVFVDRVAGSTEFVLYVD